MTIYLSAARLLDDIDFTESIILVSSIYLGYRVKNILGEVMVFIIIKLKASAGILVWEHLMQKYPNFLN